ncbi:AAA family ATPase, partial [Candidatus Binatia bacterium]|nr:AAA family ATPase [Candidatus Binatia bacterium]
MSAQDDVVRALAAPAFYPHRPADVRHHETHISHVFVAGPFAYKLKKSVQFSFADFSSVERRRTVCVDEVRLNRRLCPTLYLGVLEVVRRDDGTLALGGDGEPVEPLVWMRALPERGMLPAALADGRVDASALVAFARALAAFHASPETALDDPHHAEPAVLAERWQHVLDDALPMIGTTHDAPAHEVLADFGELFLKRHDSVLRGRAPAGRFRDGHGDLHAGNLCLVEQALPAIDGAPPVEPGLYAFDCLEFSPELRANDVASEIAFLAMDLVVRGHADLADAFVDAYVAASGDDELRVLLPFYACHRATIRGMVQGLAAAGASQAETRREAIEAARVHFAHATRLAWRAFGPAVVLCCGLSGAGKTTLAVALAESTGFRLLSSDALRKQRAGLDPHGRASEDVAARLYDPHAREAVYEEMAAAARRALAAGEPVLLDATFHRRASRAPMHALARELRVPLIVLHCVADESVVRQRLEDRASRPRESSAGQPALSDAGLEVYLAQRAAAEPPGEDEHVLRVDTAGPREEVRDRALRA